MSTPIPSPGLLRQYAEHSTLCTLADKFLRDIHIGIKTNWDHLPKSPDNFDNRCWFENCWPLIEKALGGKVTLFVVGWDTANMVEFINLANKKNGQPPIAQLYVDDVRLYTKGIIGEYEGAPMIATPYMWGDWVFVTRAPTLELVNATNSLWIDA